MMEIKFELSEKDYRYLFENASDAMWVHDMEGNVLDGNKAAEKLGGYTHEEFIGMNIMNFFVGEKTLEVAREVRRKLLSGEDIEQPYEQQLRRKDGMIRTVRMATSPITIDGVIKGFQHVARDVTGEKQLQENMRFYVQQVTRAQEDERKRLARELHDDVAPSLLLINQRLDAVAADTRFRLSNLMKEKLEDLHNKVDYALENLRRYAQDLRPRIIDDLGLVAALEWMAENLIRDCGVDARVEIKGTERTLKEEVQLLLFRIAQEALTNIRRHSLAATVRIKLEFGADKIVLSVEDNGRGFEVPRSIGDLTSSGKLGLAGMEERAQLMGGSLRLRSELGKGTTVTVEVPA